MNTDVLLQFLGFSAVASFLGFLVTQIAKKLGMPPKTILGGLSVVGGILYWAYFLLPEETRILIAGVVAAIYAGATIIYRALEKYFPELSTKNFTNE